jgi:hypothetical protein
LCVPTRVCGCVVHHARACMCVCGWVVCGCLECVCHECAYVRAWYTILSIACPAGTALLLLPRNNRCTATYTSHRSVPLGHGFGFSIGYTPWIDPLFQG